MSLALTVPSISPAHGVDAVSPPRDRRAPIADLTKSVVPLPYMVTLLVIAIGIAASLWRIDSRVSVITARIDAAEKYEQRIKDANQLYLDQLSKTLEQQIINAGLRSSAMSLTQELTAAREKLRGQ